MRIMKDHCGRRRDVVRAKHQNLIRNRLLGRLRASWERPLLGLILASKTVAKCSKLGQDGAKMAPSWPPRRILGRSWAIFAVLACPGTPWGGIWDPKGPIWAPKTLPKSTPNPSKIDQKSDFFFDTFSSCILKRFWKILAPCWLQFQRFLGTQSGFKPHRPIF